MIKWVRNLSGKRKEEILDKLHRGFVDICMGVTVVASTVMFYKVYEYFRYLRPMRQAIRERAEKDLLALGQPLAVPDTDEFED